MTRTVVLHCPDKGAVEVLVEDVHPYVLNGDGTATYSFDCTPCRITHDGLHATLGIANTLKYSGVSIEYVSSSSSE